MRLHRLRIVDTAAVREVDVAFGPGLNVLHGPNDLGKSTMADAIRLVLLLPHTSSHSECFVPWKGGGDPQVSLTFQTEEQRYWRVTKRFGTSGMSLLEESRDGNNFDEIAKSRGVDGKLRELLRWGIPEPGGASGARSFPTSFLATVLLSTQAAVGAVLKDSLGDDPDVSGKERITSALNAVAQDPLFKSLLQQAQERRDEAYTPTGGRKQSKTSPFKTAAERVNNVRTEKESWQAAVDESESIETSLRELAGRKATLQESVANASSQVASMERLVLQARMLSEADERVRLARQDVERITRLTDDVERASDAARDLKKKLDTAAARLSGAEKSQSDAEAVLEAEAKKARDEAAAAVAAEVISRKALDARRVAAESARDASQRRIESLGTAKTLVDAAAAADQQSRERQSDVDRARVSLDKLSSDAQAAAERLRRVELLQQASQVQLAESQLIAAQMEVEKRESAETRLQAAVKDRELLIQRRAGLVVPEKSDIVNMRRLSQELAGARGALEVGLQVVITRSKPVEVRARRDGVSVDDVPPTGLVNVEAEVAIDIEIGDIATVQIRGGAREAQANVRSLEERWQKEVVPHLNAAKVTDLESLDHLLDDAREIDAALKALDAEMGTLRTQIDSLGSAAAALRAAEARVKESRATLGDAPIESLIQDLATLGSNPQGSLHKQREQALSAMETVRAAGKEAEISQSVAEDRLKHAYTELEKATKSRDEALAAFSGDLTGEFMAAQSAFDTAVTELEKVAAELKESEQTAAQQTAKNEETIAGAQAKVDSARSLVEAARAGHQQALTAHASEEARSKELRRLLEAEDRAKAENALAEATIQHAALPKPDHVVTEADLNAATNAEAKAESDLKAVETAIQQKQGALQHVGGMVAHDRLRDATEALALAEQHEREVEVDSEAWKLLLEQMREAESAQASNLGLALAPSISVKFEELTKKRYDGVQLTNELATEGVLMGGAVRSSDRLSVGTREQLSTLYRLALAEYLQTAVVLDDQLVQSDNSRMDWFRKLLADKARTFQIVVFTCRPDDYLAPTAIVPTGASFAADSDDGFVRAIDLRLAVKSR